MPRRVEDQIAALEERMAQERARLQDLRAQANKQQRRDDARRKVLYGAAYLAGLETLGEDAKRRSLERVERHVTRPRDREFLGLGPLPKPKAETAAEPIVPAAEARAVTLDLPFGDGGQV